VAEKPQYEDEYTELGKNLKRQVTIGADNALRTFAKAQPSASPFPFNVSRVNAEAFLHTV
jgi:hypothetical protein